VTPEAAAAAAAGWILPIQPRYAALIRSGEKSVELRSYNTRIAPGDWVLIYESQPISAITCALLIGSIEQHAPDRLWADPGPHRLGVSPEAWQRAFASVPTIWVHRIEQVIEMPAVGRAELASRWPGFRPPQRAQRRRQEWESPPAWLEPAPVEPIQLLLPMAIGVPHGERIAP
jgi:hypothetical protein